ncbi:MAG: exosortase X [Janthinobacterium lividum]
MAASPFATLSPAATPAGRQFWRFGLLSVALMLLWAIGSAYGLGSASPLDEVLCQQLAASSAWGLRALGWLASVAPYNLSLLLLNGQPTVIVGPACDGLVLYMLLAGFVIAYPGPAMRRLWFIPLGIIGLWLLNILRIMALALNHRYSPNTFDFDHHYAFSAVAYAALGGLWLLWTRQSLSAAPVGAASAAAERPAPAAQWLTPRVGVGVLFLMGLTWVGVYQNVVVAALSAGWAAALAEGPAWLHQLPGATVGDVPTGVSHLALPVGVAFMGLFIGLSLLILYLLVPARSWRLVWRSYAGLGLACLLLLLLGRAGAGTMAYRPARMLLDFMVSLLPVAGLLVLLWRPAVGVAPVAQR